MMDTLTHVEPDRRVIEKLLFLRRIFADFSSCRGYKLIVWLKYVLQGLDIWLTGRKIALLSENRF